MDLAIHDPGLNTKSGKEFESKIQFKSVSSKDYESERLKFKLFHEACKSIKL